MKEKLYNFVYKVTNKINDKEYIGVHSTDNLDDGYMGSGNLIRMALKKYGIENFYREIIQFFDTRNAAYKLEQLLVTEEYIKNPNTYNICFGGKIPPIHYGIDNSNYVVITVEQEDKIIELYDNGIGMSTEKISKQLSLPNSRIRKLLHEHNIDTSIATIHKLKKSDKKWEDIFINNSAIDSIEQLKANAKNRRINYNKSLPKEERTRRAKLANAARQLTDYHHSEETIQKIRQSNIDNNTYCTKSDEYKQMISNKTKEAINKIDKGTRDAWQKKAIDGRIKCWAEKNRIKKEIILNLKDQNTPDEDIRLLLHISIPTYKTRINELKSEGKLI